MKPKNLLAILLATIWISLNEFLRNELFFNYYWTDHYEKLGLIFPAEPINGAIWGIWSLLFAVAICLISGKFSLIQTTFLSWLVGFILMWVVIGNMGVLPFKILFIAAPWSLVEVFGSVWIIRKILINKS